MCMNDFFILMKPELLLFAIILLLLLLKLGKWMSNQSVLGIVQGLLLINFIAGFVLNAEGHLFDGMYETNALIVLQKNILNGGMLMIALLFSGWLVQTKHLSEFFILMLSSMLGMFFLVSSGHMLMFYLAMELISIPAAALVNFHLEKKNSSEAGMKMILSSAFSSGILLFGISLIYGTTGTLRFADMPALFTGSNLQIMAFVFFFVALAFKLSVVPFHLWTADVYQGAPVAVAAFLSVLSKGAIAFTLIAVLYHVFAPLHAVWYWMLVALAVLTMVTGNLFALRQQNIKRFLAFSSIAQVGFILVGISSFGAAGTASVMYFILIYLFSNLAAFAVADLVSLQSGKENIDDYKGLYQTNPFLVWMMALALFSLAGIPPTAGFFGKLFLLSSGAMRGNYIFIGIAAINMIISLYYYLRIVRAMFMDKNDHPVPSVSVPGITRAALWLCGAGIVAAGLVGWLYDYMQRLSQ